MNTVQAEAIRIEKTGAAAPMNWWSWLSWFTWPVIIGIAVLLAIFLILIPIILRRINQRY